MTEPATPDQVDQVIGENVHRLIWRQRISQRKFADQMGIGQSLLSKKIRGDSTWSARQVSAAAAALGVEPGSLFAVGPAGLEPATYGLQGRSFARLVDLTAARERRVQPQRRAA